MPAKNKKGKVKASRGFDYEAIIPSSLSEEDRELVKKFLTNKLETAEDRDAALAVFAAAMIEERANIFRESDSEDEELLNGLRAVAASGGGGGSGAGAAEGGGGGSKPTGSNKVTPTAVVAAAAASLAERRQFTLADHIVVKKTKGSGSEAPKTATAPAVATSKLKRNGPVLDIQEKHVKAELAIEIRKKVNVGWWASSYDADEKTDTRIPEYATALGGELYNFISYPIGGMGRSSMQLVPGCSVPPIALPDLQLANPYWETYVAGHPSAWIDCDAAEEWAAEMSVAELRKELAYAHYLGLNTVVIEMKRRSNPRLARVIGHFLWTVQSNLKICMLMPTQASSMQGEAGDEREVWEMWADFRTSMGNYSNDRLICGIKLMEDLDDEFVEAAALERWRVEPLIMFTMETAVFTTTNNRTGGADLAPAHKRLIETLWTSEDMCAAIWGADPRGARLQYAQAIRSIIGPLWLDKRLTKKQNFLDASEINYQDVIQKPLQPLADNLQSGVYNTFEADAPKYKYYGEATEAAILDMVRMRGTGDIVLYVLGAGRGPLMSAAMAAEKRVNERVGNAGPRVRMELVCVEKNENAVVTLTYLNAQSWRGRVRIVQADMRELKQVATDLGLRRPDIIVSELLGSFGDNELSPECLDGCIDWLKEDTISIPQSYTSYCEPLASPSLYNTIRAQPSSVYVKGRQANGRALTRAEEDGTWTQEFPQGREVAALDMLYIVFLEKAVRQMTPKPYFTFQHPSTDGGTQSKRPQWRTSQQWTVPQTHDIMGFACYFSARLYKDVTLSIVRGQETQEMLSWFPGVLPLRTPIRVHKGEILSFTVDRCTDAGGVWYEWFAHASTDDKTLPPVITTEVQNKGGESYYMRLLGGEESSPL